MLSAIRSLIFLTSAAFLASAQSTSVAADDTGPEQVWPMLAAQSQASGSFTQELFSEEGDLLERSSGRYAVLRPRYFRWEIEQPDRQKIYLAGETLWHYDIDLATASRRNTRGESQFTPLELLSGDIDALRERFVVEALPEQRFRLQPTFSGAGFSAVEMRWDDGEIVAMEIRDRSGQEIRLALMPDTAAVALTPDDFVFVAPAAVEIHEQLPL